MSSIPSFPDPSVPPPPSFSNAPKKKIQIKIDPLKSKLNAIQKKVLEETVYDMTKEPETRQKVPTEFKDILPLDDYVNIWNLSNYRASLTKSEVKDIKNIAKILKTHKLEFEEMYDKATKMIKAIDKNDPETRVKAAKFIEQIEQQSRLITQDVEEVKRKIEYIRGKPVKPAALTQAEGAGISGTGWYADVKKLYKTEIEDQFSYIEDYRREIEKGEKKGLDVSNKKTHLAKLITNASFSKWLGKAYKKLEDDDDSLRAAIIRDAVITLGGAKQLEENLKDFEKKLNEPDEKKPNNR